MLNLARSKLKLSVGPLPKLTTFKSSNTLRVPFEAQHSNTIPNTMAHTVAFIFTMYNREEMSNLTSEHT